MATLIIEGRSFEIAPYKLGSLRRAAPHIDAINAAINSIDSLEGMMENLEHVVAVLSVGLVRVDPTLTPEALGDMVGMDDMPALRDALREVLQESGLTPKGEATAPTAPEVADVGASENSSETSSVN